MLPTQSGAPLLLLGLAAASHLSHSPHNETTLEWTPCEYDFEPSHKALLTEPYECATLPVPLDYTNYHSETLSLSLIRIKANKEPVEGTVIFNPGGPGSSGLIEVSQHGPMVIGGHYHVVGFDARGTGRTIPYVCDLTSAKLAGSGQFNTSSSSGESGEHEEKVDVPPRQRYATIPQDDPYKILVDKAWEDGKVIANGCAASQNKTGRYVGTAFTARDMLAIVSALGEDGQLRFWGRSYSTVLGQTFAAMFPDRVDRMLLEAVLLAEDYYSGRWLAATRDVESSLENFFRECIKLGPETCPPASFHSNSTTPQSLMKELAQVLQELIDEPVYVGTEYLVREWWRQDSRNPVYLQLKFNIMNFLFNPIYFLPLVGTIQEALGRNWTSFMTPLPPQPVEENWHQGVHGFHGIACSDNQLRFNRPEDMWSLVEAQSAQSSWADAFSPQVWPCAHWQLDAAERYSGSWENIRTRNPIMLVNGRYDPITPLSSAQETAVRFRDSRLLIHEGVGHGVARQPSNCTWQAIGNYFANGTLPEINARCHPDVEILDIALAALGEAGGGIEG
ncbi:putative hydrolase [Paramyrothecium foliicola]|nr:putative hydrolase [Paramyrothecium foliicola]